MPSHVKSSDAAIQEAIVAAVKRCGAPRDAQYWREMLTDLVRNNAIPIELLADIPLRAGEAPRTRFDQLYAASLALVFPGYREATLKALLASSYEMGLETKIWRVVFPEKFKLAHVLIRADSMQEAFAYASDYACRASLRLFRRIPPDLTVRVMFMSEKALRRHLHLRWANRVHKRKQLQLGHREFTRKQIDGAKTFALGVRGTDRYSIAKYAEEQDLRRLRKVGYVRRSVIEHESFRD